MDQAGSIDVCTQQYAAVRALVYTIARLQHRAVAWHDAVQVCFHQGKALVAVW